MAWKRPLLHLTTFLLTLNLYVHAQNISPDTPVPPLQWINLSGLLQGSSKPPPLKNAAIGYDETSRSVIIFGGESASGLVQSQTYLLNLETLTWSIPSPPTNLQRTPAARSAAVSGGDFAASNRHGFIIIGGKGSDGSGLADVWEYDFNNQFWSEVNMSPGGPLPRWGASGGIDIFTPPIQDPVVPGPNNTFYLAGGHVGTKASPLSDIWRLNISGTLSSNLPNDSTGSWDRVSIGQSPSGFDQASTVISHQIVTTGGCNSTLSGGTCPLQDSHIIDVQRRTDVSPSTCPAPRTGPVLVPNASRFTSTFSSQVLLLLGTLNHTKWDDENGLVNGEIAILDINTGTWSRILPAGDPGTSNKVTFPTPREGSAAFSYPSALVGRSRAASSDTIVFGGEDSSGNILSEVWLLRAYNGIITPSQLIWPGFGNGRLQTGIDANGAGVRITYVTKCALMTAVTGPVPPGGNTSPNNTSPSNTPPDSSLPNPTVPVQTVHLFNTSLVHKILAPVSLIILQLMFLCFRLASPFYQGVGLRRALYGYISFALALVAYALGAAGIATSFITLSAPTPSTSGRHLQTGHGIAGLIFFSLLYILVPVLLLISSWRRHPRDTPKPFENERIGPEQVQSPDTIEKVDPFSGPSRSVPHSVRDASLPPSPRPRTNSWGGMMSRSYEGRLSSDSESIGSASPQRGFEVVNRPSRARKASGGSWRLPPPGESSLDHFATRSLQEIDWLQRRRSLNAVGELDYAITQARREQLSLTPATADELMAAPSSTRTPLNFPTPSNIVLHSLIQTILLGLSIVTLIALWSRASRALFALFLAWTVVFYLAIFIFAWHLRPDGSMLSALCSHLGSKSQDITTRPTSIQGLQEPSPGPYVHHQPPYRAAVSPVDGHSSSRSPRSVDTISDHEGDIDDDTGQRMIEEEMGRRDVSIVTVPKRKLWITNPS